MNDNFDLRTYMTSKRLLTENYENIDGLGPIEPKENDEVEGSYPWSKHEDNYPDVNISDEVPIDMDEPESLVDQNAEYRTDYKEEPDGFNYMEEESIDEESDNEFSEDKLMSDLNEGEEDMISENDWSPLIPVLAGATGVILTSMGISKVLDSLRNGKLGEEGKKLADALKKLGNKKREEDMISENDWSPLIPVLAGATGVILTSMGISKVLDSLRNGKLGEEGKKLADALKKLGNKTETK